MRKNKILDKINMLNDVSTVTQPIKMKLEIFY